MLLPMMGFLFFLIVAGLFFGLLLVIVRPWKSLAPFIAFPLILAGLFAFALCWGLGFSAEKLLHSESIASLGFLGGYVVGGLLGGGLGLVLALKVRRRLRT
jgi:hypothetical protein